MARDASDLSIHKIGVHFTHIDRQRLPRPKSVLKETLEEMPMPECGLAGMPAPAYGEGGMPAPACG